MEKQFYCRKFADYSDCKKQCKRCNLICSTENRGFEVGTPFTKRKPKNYKQPSVK